MTSTTHTHRMNNSWNEEHMPFFVILGRLPPTIVSQYYDLSIITSVQKKKKSEKHLLGVLLFCPWRNWTKATGFFFSSCCWLDVRAGGVRSLSTFGGIRLSNRAFSFSLSPLLWLNEGFLFFCWTTRNKKSRTLTAPEAKKIGSQIWNLNEFYMTLLPLAHPWKTSRAKVSCFSLEKHNNNLETRR